MSNRTLTLNYYSLFINSSLVICKSYVNEPTNIITNKILSVLISRVWPSARNHEIFIIFYASLCIAT